MLIRTSKYVLALFVSFLFVVSIGCDEEAFNSCNKGYNFSFPVELNPQLDTISVHDTLMISFTYSDSLVNLVDGEYVSINDLPLDLRLDCYWIHLNPAGGDQLDFNLTEEIGQVETFTYSWGDVAFLLRPEHVDGLFKIKLGLIPKSTGIASIVVSNREPLAGFPNRIEENCRADSIRLYFSINDQIDNNFHLNEFSPDPNIQEMTREFFDRHGAYNIVVVD